MSKEYRVTVPVVLAMEIFVKADSEKEAKGKVFSDNGLIIEVKDPENNFEGINWEWDMYDPIVKGNVFQAHINKVHVDSVYHEEEADE